MKSTSVQPRKQRLAAAGRSHANQLRAMSAHLSDELLKEYSLRSLTVRRGDMVKVLRGSYKDHEGKVVKVFPQKGLITIEGATRTKIDNKTVSRMFRPSKVVITKLDLSDPWRREKLQRFRVAEKKEKKERVEEKEEREEKETAEKKESKEGVEEIEKGEEREGAEKKERKERVEEKEKGEEKEGAEEKERKGGRKEGAVEMEGKGGRKEAAGEMERKREKREEKGAGGRAKSEGAGGREEKVAKRKEKSEGAGGGGKEGVAEGGKGEQREGA